MARCGCASDCLCTVTGTDCVDVIGNGTPTSPYVVSVLLDPSENNQASCGPDGLMVDVSGVAIATEDSACIELSGSGTPIDPIVATPILDESDANILECGENGLSASPIGAALWTIQSIDSSSDPFEASFGDLVLADTTGGDINVQLPPAGGVVGGEVCVKKTAADNSAIIDPYGLQLVDGQLDAVLEDQWSSVTLASDGSSWYVIAYVPGNVIASV